MVTDPEKQAGSAPIDGNYWTYWVHKVQELWKRVEAIEERLDALEVLTEESDGEDSETAPAPEAVSTLRKETEKLYSERGTDANPSLTERELTVCMALKELGKGATLEEINSHLKNSRMISEGLRDTLVARLKGAVEKGYVAYDDSAKQFFLSRKTFLVE